MSDAFESTLTLPADHPVFAGHFPAHPIVPGALILDEVLRLLSEHTAAGPVVVRSAKFIHPATPGQPLQVTLRPGDDGAFDFRVTTGDTLVASGALRAG